MSRLIRPLVACVASLLITGACASDHTVIPPARTTGDTILVKVAGDNQAAPVVTVLPGTLISQVYIDTTKGVHTLRVASQLVPGGARASGDTNVILNLGLPLKNSLVSFVVREGETACGHPGSNAEFTDSLGVVKQHWIMGQLAGVDCHLDVTHVDQTTGALINYATFTGQGQPGPAKKITEYRGDTTVAVGTVIDLRPLIYTVQDAYGNTVKTYQISYTRENTDTTLNDRIYLVGNAVTIRAGDRAVGLRVDSADANGFGVHTTP